MNDPLPTPQDAQQLQASMPDLTLLKKFTSSLAHVRANRQTYRGRRSTLTYSNALHFVPYLIHLMENPAEGIVIPRSQFPTTKLITLYLKWQGALQYFVENKTGEHSDYQQAAALVKTSFIARIDAAADVLRIEPRTGHERTAKNTLRSAHAIVTKARHDTPRVEWKNDFLDWVAAGEVGIPFIRKGLALEAEDVEFVRSLSVDNGWDHDVTLNQIKVVKL